MATRFITPCHRLFMTRNEKRERRSARSPPFFLLSIFLFISPDCSYNQVFVCLKKGTIDAKEEDAALCGFSRQ
jgi:hypothetical protein